jgi:ubiquinone/menaquinone biosynthesis C-methylase UbiE
MDEIARYNKERWEALSAANVAFARPMLNLNADSARKLVDPYDVMGDVAGKNVLCLGSGGGQQSAAFALLGAEVTVVDISETQLARDRIALAHYGLTATLIQGDMRDLSSLGDKIFDVVWHAFSINFVPDSGIVFDQVLRVLRPGGQYRMEWHNPFLVNADAATWTGAGYCIKGPYSDGEIVPEYKFWEFEDDQKNAHKVEGPREFNHTLSTILNGLIRRGFLPLGLWETTFDDLDPNAEPGTWDHMLRVLPPMLVLWARWQA